MKPNLRQSKHPHRAISASGWTRSRFLLFLILLQVILLSLGAILSIGARDDIVCANAFDQELQMTSGEAPRTLSDLQRAGDEQLGDWADTLTKFDGRDFGYITPARNQYTKNTCWAFAAVGAAETNILRKGIDASATKENLDLDETIAAYNRHTRDGDYDPLFLTTNDTYNYGTWNQGDTGAVNAFSIMTQGYTLLPENSFHSSVPASTIKSKLQPSRYYVQSYQNISNERSAIKRAILRYGAVAFNYSHPTANQYYSNSDPADHTSIIIGWDDTVKKTAFSPKHPVSDGAWIIKNSWGDAGYNKINGTWCYYISYELPIGALYSIDLAMQEDYQNIYHYDGNVTISMNKTAGEAQAAIYEAKLSSPTKQEQLKAVMLYVPQEDVDVNVKIYRNLRVNPGNVNDPINIPDRNDPAVEMDAHIERSGMHTIDLKDPLDLGQGEYFSIVVRCRTRSNVSVPISCAVDGNASVNDMTYYLQGGKWISFKNSNAYADSSASNRSAKIRAITNTVDRKTDLGNDLQYARVEIANRLVYYVKNQQLAPALAVYSGDKLLTEERDYRVEVQKIASPGMTTIKIMGMGEYSGVRITSFEVAKPPHPPGVMNGTVDVYNDAIRLYDIPLPADWEWIDRDRELGLGKSDSPVSIRYVGADKEFYQNLTCDFYINKLAQDPPADTDISSATVEVEGEYRYTGEAIEPSVKVICQGKTLRPSIDYLLTYQNNINAGTATVIVEGRGRYFHQISRDFEIQKADRPTSTPPSSMTVLRRAKTLEEVPLAKGWHWEEPKRMIDEESLQAWAAYSDTVNYETYRVEITVIKEPPKDVSEVSVELEALSYIYNGEERTPSAVVKDGDFLLASGVDFEIEYQNNLNAGQASVTVKGKNDYTGSRTCTFTIERAERQHFKVELSDWTYGDATTPTPRTEGQMEPAPVTYTYSDAQDGVYTERKPTDAGAYWIRAEIQPSQNYRSAAAKAPFTIAKADRPTPMPAPSMTVLRRAKTLEEVPLAEGWHWEEPKRAIDEESLQAWAVYSDTVNYETYRTEITVIKEPPKDASELSAELETSSFIYNGEKRTPSVVVKDGDFMLVSGVDFEIEYQNNLNAGTGKAIVTFQNDYSGTRELAFTIERAEKPNVNTTIKYREKATKLSEIALPDGFVWDDGDMELSGDRTTAKAVYRGDDAENYKTTELYFELIFEEQDKAERQGNLMWLAIVLPASALTAGLGFALAKYRRKKQ